MTLPDNCARIKGRIDGAGRRSLTTLSKPRSTSLIRLVNSLIRRNNSLFRDLNSLFLGIENLRKKANRDRPFFVFNR
jgi:hypothetical protein